MKHSKKGFLDNVLELVTGTTIAQIVGIVIVPILARLFSPNDFGTADLFVSISSVIGVVVCLRYELAIMLPDSDVEAINVLVGALLSAFLVSLLSGLGLFLCRNMLLQWLQAPDLHAYLRYIPFVVWLMGVNVSLTYWLSRQKRFRELSFSRVANTVGSTGTKLSAGLLGIQNATGLITGYIAGLLASVSTLVWWTRRDYSILSEVDFHQILDKLIHYRNFPLISSWSALLNVASVQIPIFLLSALFSQTVVGYYGLSLRVIQLPMSLIGAAVAQVFFQRASEAHRTGQLSTVVYTVYKQLVKFALFPMLVLSLVGKELFVIVFGSQWSEAGIYAQILSFWRFWVFIGSPISTLPSVLQRQNVELSFNILLFTSRVAALLIGGAIGDPVMALTFYAGSGAILWAGFVGWACYVSDVEVKKAVWFFIKNLLFISPLLIFIAFLKWIVCLPAVAIMILSASLVLLYYGIIILCDDSWRAKFVSIVQRFTST
jgi:lipopolysaccharide exporter